MKRICISNLLDQLGCPPERRGNLFLSHAVALCLCDPSYLHSITTRLYPKIAHFCSTTVSNIEKSISRTIQTIYECKNRSLLERLAGHPLPFKPSNSECIAILYEVCQLHPLQHSYLK